MKMAKLMRFSKVSREAQHWTAKRAEERAEEVDVRPADECQCGPRAARGPTYSGQPTCRICHRFLGKGRR